MFCSHLRDNFFSRIHAQWSDTKTHWNSTENFISIALLNADNPSKGTKWYTFGHLLTPYAFSRCISLPVRNWYTQWVHFTLEVCFQWVVLQLPRRENRCSLQVNLRLIWWTNELIYYPVTDYNSSGMTRRYLTAFLLFNDALIAQGATIISWFSDRQN